MLRHLLREDSRRLKVQGTVWSDFVVVFSPVVVRASDKLSAEVLENLNTMVKGASVLDLTDDE